MEGALASSVGSTPASSANSEDLSLEQCAERLGITFQHLGNVELGLRTPSMSLIARMASIADGAVMQEENLGFTTQCRGAEISLKSRVLQDE